MFEDTNRYTVFVQLALVGYESTTEYSHCMCQCMSVQFDVNKKQKNKSGTCGCSKPDLMVPVSGPTVSFQALQGSRKFNDTNPGR